MQLPASSFKRPVAFFSNGFGDALLTLPALRALSSAFCNRLRLVHSGGPHTFLFDELPLEGRIVVPMWRVDGKRHFDPGYILSRIGDCDLFISLVPWISHQLRDLVDKLSVTSVGYYEPYSIRSPLDFTKHSAELTFDLARLFSNARIDQVSYSPLFPPSAIEFVATIKNTLPNQTRILSVHMDTVPEKMWPADRFSACLREFLRLRSDFIVMLVGLGDRQLDLGRYNYRLMECRGLSMATTFALVAHSDLFFGIDSCMLHIADLARVPGVAIFGPTSAVEFGFRLTRGIALQGRTSTDEIYPENALSALLRLSDNSCRLAGQEIVVT